MPPLTKMDEYFVHQIPELLPEVAEGVAYVNGVRAKRSDQEVAA